MEGGKVVCADCKPIVSWWGDVSNTLKSYRHTKTTLMIINFKRKIASLL